MKWIYKNNIDNTNRFVLGEVSDEGKPLICFGVNPSTATPDKLDTTITKLRKFSQILGYDGWIMLNLYPQRTTNPEELDKTENKELSVANLRYIYNIIDKYKPSNIWASWGELIEIRDYLVENLEKICTQCLENDINFIHLGELTKKGHPRHPSRLAYSSEKIIFDISEYISKLKK